MVLLTVGLTTYDDFDGVYFTLQGFRLSQGRDAGDVEFIILDNHPGGPVGPTLAELAGKVPGCRYIPFAGYTGTSVHNLIFREATSEYVLCMDSHVLLAPGSVRRLLHYFEEHPGCQDLVQGPRLPDDLVSEALTHLSPKWHRGMWGSWASDPRGQHPDGEPFEIDMQGLGLFSCRRDAWPGLHPHLRGHGGEEGYLHEKFRQGGGTVVCHPGVRWLHRHFRPGGVPYPLGWRDRARNYLLIFEELSLDPAPFEAHLGELLGPEQAAAVLARARREAANPLRYFDAIFCIHRDASASRWSLARKSFASLGIDWLVEPIFARFEDGEELARVLCSIIEMARRRGLSKVLIVDDESVPSPDFLDDFIEIVTGSGPAPLQTFRGMLAVHETAYEHVLTGGNLDSGPVRDWVNGLARNT